MEKRRSILSLCIAMALSGNSFAADTNDTTKNEPQTINCSDDSSTLSTTDKEKYNAQCKTDDNLLEWVAAGVAAVGAAVGIAVYNDDDGDSHSSADTGPTPPDPDPTPDPDPDPTPDPDPQPTLDYSNGVTVDPNTKTITFDAVTGQSDAPVTFTYVKNGSDYVLTAPDGRTLTVTGWKVTADNQLAITGQYGSDSATWIYDRSGNFTFASADTNTFTGDGTSNTVDGDTSASGSGEAGTIVSGDDTKTDVNGDTAATDGGTGTKVDGDNAEVNNNGNTTVDGDGSTGTAITGDGAVVNNGDTAATGGGTGTKVDGDNAQINNNGNATVDGSGSTGTAITGDGAVVNNGGDATISGGGTGTRVDGNDAVIVNTGDTTADGEGSAGTVINGDNASFDQQGDITVTNGATGIAVNGAAAKIDNSGTITVKDAGSVGVNVSGDNATFINTGTIDSSLNGTGVSITGDSASVTLDGTVNVHAEKNADGVYQAATGVSVAGNNSATEITGDVAISGSMATDEEATTTGKLDGINVSGNSNSVVLDGTLSMILDSQSQPFSASGITVTGSDNDVQIKGGVTISSQGGALHSAKGIIVTGNNTVTVSGHSTIDTVGIGGTPTIFASVNEGGKVILTENSVLDTSFTNLDATSYSVYSLLQATGLNSSIVNEGIINTDVGMVVMRADQGASVSNSGTINVTPAEDETRRTAMMQADGADSVATNESGGTINIESTLTPYWPGAYAVIYPATSYNNTEYALMASNYGSVENDAGATINLTGAGLYGLGAAKGTATNAGTINVDGFIPTLDEEGTVTSKTFWQDSGALYTMSAGMIIGSTDAGYGDATGLNIGTINVNNEGFGMLALNGGTVTNQGTINLTADEGVTASADNQLIGMGVMNGGTAINDESGTININADYGQAFYNDGTGIIFNYGAINLNGSPMDDSDEHMGDAPTDAVWLKNLTGSGDTDTRASDTGFAITDAMANYGSETLTGDVTSADWLYNEGNGSLTVNGGLTVITGLENSGTLQADTISASSSLYNRASGSMTTNTLSLNNSAIFFNEGDFTGSVIADSKDQYVVNTGDMTVAEDGKSLASGTFRFFNQQGATLSNTGNAVEGGENSIINVTNTSTSYSLYQVNNGTITATNGYSAIKTANTSALGAWIWNTETGVINGVNPDAPLVDLGTGYNFSNAGTINVQGDNAVAISGGTGYTIKLVNSGTINVGTEEGKADGTNGTGLIGIKGNGTSTTINNTADGVINVYADDSYAFGGKTKAIINNGSINLLCDTGCGIYAPGTTYTTDTGEDIAVPTANTAPSQGTVPTPPADPNAPQVLTDYVIGTNADGSAGTLKASNLVIGDDVKVNTGFTSGTAATTVVLQDTFTGSNIQGADNITSTSVVWNAQGSTDAQGNVDVTMTKNAYADVATDGSVSSVATALDAGYTNNELYNSLNVGSTAELNSALKQVSGSQATSVFREARMLSNRFDMLADAAPQVSNGLAFNVVAKGDPRAELGKNTDYDMLALRQKLDLTGSQNLTMEYGIARLDGSGSSLAGDNGITGGYSQFFGLKHQMAFEGGLSWNNALRYDVHNLDSNRSVSYGDTSKTADSSARQQYLEFRSEGAKAFELSEALTVTPYAGVKLRHTLEDGYQERNAGDFNLNMNSGSETAVDSIVGMKLDYAGKNGWGASATFEGGPNLSYSKSQRSATLAGAGSQRFAVDDGQTGGGVNSLATVGVKYSGESSALQLDAFHWREDGISDKGMMLNVKKTF